MYLIRSILVSFAFFEGLSTVCAKNYDVSVAGYTMFGDSIGRITVGFIDSIKDTDLKINFIPTRSRSWLSLKDIPLKAANIIKENTNRIPGKVTIFFDLLSPSVPQSPIKIAYSTLESTAIPAHWVSLLNTKFDAVVVPDEFFVQVYKNSGVKIPIFMVPEGMYLEEFLNKPLKKQKNVPFTFGISAGFWERKNHLLLIQAFKEVFGDSDQVKLKIHGRFGEKEVLESVKHAVRGTKNIEFVSGLIRQKSYIDFLSSLDCYVLLSKGEGFSLTPREAMALGIPCILSNNTAHITICRTGLVRAVEANLREPAYYACFKSLVGDNFNCKIEDVKAALKDVYENYETYLAKGPEARTWASQYLYDNLKPYHLSLVKPKRVLFGNHNKIEKEYLMTNSPILCMKYKRAGLDR